MTREEAILLSAYTGFLFAPDFSEVHKFCEDTLGRPIWTHEFADSCVQKEIQEKLRPQIMELVQNISALRPVSREAWEPCKICNGKTTLYQYTANTKLFMNTFGHAATLVTECMGCPPYAECCMKGISTNSAFKINFCPECGRPLTEEAWAELERRLIK